MTTDRAENLPERCTYSDPYDAEGFEDETKRCDWCGKECAGKFCSRSCRLAAESDRC